MGDIKYTPPNKKTKEVITGNNIIDNSASIIVTTIMEI